MYKNGQKNGAEEHYTEKKVPIILSEWAKMLQKL